MPVDDCARYFSSHLGHCGVCPGATDNSCLCWNAPEVLEVIQAHSRCVLMYLSGHDHAGGRKVDDTGILHMAYHGVLENNVDADFSTCYVYGDRLVMKGNGRVPNLELPLRYQLDPHLWWQYRFVVDLKPVVSYKLRIHNGCYLLELHRVENKSVFILNIFIFKNMSFINSTVFVEYELLAQWTFYSMHNRTLMGTNVALYSLIDYHYFISLFFLHLHVAFMLWTFKCCYLTLLF